MSRLLAQRELKLRINLIHKQFKGPTHQSATCRHSNARRPLTFDVTLISTGILYGFHRGHVPITKFHNTRLAKNFIFVQDQGQDVLPPSNGYREVIWRPVLVKDVHDCSAIYICHCQKCGFLPLYLTFVDPLPIFIY